MGNANVNDSHVVDDQVIKPPAQIQAQYNVILEEINDIIQNSPRIKILNLNHGWKKSMKRKHKIHYYRNSADMENEEDGIPYEASLYGNAEHNYSFFICWRRHATDQDGMMPVLVLRHSRSGHDDQFLRANLTTNHNLITRRPNWKNVHIKYIGTHGEFSLQCEKTAKQNFEDMMARSVMAELKIQGLSADNHMRFFEKTRSDGYSYGDIKKNKFAVQFSLDDRSSGDENRKYVVQCAFTTKEGFTKTYETPLTSISDKLNKGAAKTFDKKKGYTTTSTFSFQENSTVMPKLPRELRFAFHYTEHALQRLIE